MKDKLELQKQYIEVKKKYDELSDFYWNYKPTTEEEQKYWEFIGREVRSEYLLLKSLNKQIYYER